jgi:hypothetical protein
VHEVVSIRNDCDLEGEPSAVASRGQLGEQLAYMGDTYLNWHCLVGKRVWQTHRPDGPEGTRSTSTSDNRHHSGGVGGNMSHSAGSGNATLKKGDLVDEEHF